MFVIYFHLEINGMVVGLVVKYGLHISGAFETVLCKMITIDGIAFLMDRYVTSF